MSERVLQACRRWVSRTTGLPLASVIPADAEGTKPDLPFAAVRLITTGNMQTKGEVFQEAVQGEGVIMNVVQHHGGTLSVNVYGADASQYIDDAVLHIDLDNTQPVDDGGDGYVVITDSLGVNDVAAQLDTSIEPRAQGDFAIRYAVTLATGVSRDEAKRIIAEGTYNDDIEQTITVEAPED